MAAGRGFRRRFGLPKGPGRLLRRNTDLSNWGALLDYRLTLCVAPAGFGKSALLGNWFRELDAAGYRVVWLSLTSADADPESLIDSLETAVRQVSGDDGQPGTIPDLPPPAAGMPFHARALQRLLTQLAGVDEPLLLFLDNYQEVDGEQMGPLFDQLLQRASGDCHFIIGSRSEPCFRYAALVLAEEARLFDAEALKFDVDETARFIRDNVAGVVLYDEDVALIHQKTEGWPIAVQLCCLLVNQRKSTLFLSDFSGRDVDLGHFLNEQVLRLLPDELQRFAARLAMLDCFCAPLCDEVLARRDSAAQIAELLRQKLFIYSLDRNGLWFRFHPMFREFLLGTRLLPAAEEMAAILTAAALWSRENGRYVDAIGYSVRARNYALASEMLIVSAQTMVRDEGLLPNLLQWSRQIPAEDTEASFDLRFWTCWSLTFSCRYEEAEVGLRLLERSLTESLRLQPTAISRRRTHIGALRVALRTFQDRVDVVYRASEQWLAKYRRSADPFHGSVVAGGRFLSARLQLEVVEARRALETAKNMIIQAHSNYGRTWILTLDSLGQMEFGDYRIARETLLREYDETSGAGGEVNVIHSTVALLLAKVVFEQGDTETALGYLQRGYVHIMDHGLVETAAAGIEVRCYSAARCDHERAMGEVRKAELLTRHYPPRLRFILRQIGFNLLLNAGLVADALREAEVMGITADGLPAPDEESKPLVFQQQQVMMVKLLLLDKRVDAARELLRQLMMAASTSQRPRFHVELLVLDASAQAQGGQVQGACRTAMKALATAVKNGLFQVFLEYAYFFVPVARLLLARRTVAAGEEDQLLRRLAAELGLVARKEAIEPASAPVELTRRERELLQLLETGLPVQALAEHLFVSKATVKWHLYNLYGKLGVRNRAGAVIWAQRNAG